MDCRKHQVPDPAKMVENMTEDDFVCFEVYIAALAFTYAPAVKRQPLSAVITSGLIMSIKKITGDVGYYLLLLSRKKYTN